MVKVPPDSSSSVSLPSRARWPRSAIVFSISAKLMLVGIAHHRHDQPLLGADRDADVVMVLVDDVVAVDLGIGRRNLLERDDAALTKNDMKPSRTPCFFSKLSR